MRALRRFSLAAVAAVTGLVWGLAGPALAQDTDAAKARETAELVRAFSASMGLNEPSNFGSDAGYAYENKVWDLAFSWSNTACSGNNAEGCDILGRLLAEGRVGPPDARGAEAAHRKAASLYAGRCRAGATLIGEVCGEAGDFMAVHAVPAVRNLAMARTFYTRSRDDYVRSCNQGGYDCFAAGFMTEGDFTGRSDPAAAVKLWRRGCDGPERSDQSSSCNRLVKTLADGPAGVRDPGEARRRISADQCTYAAPAGRDTVFGLAEYCAIVAEYMLDGVGGPADPKKGEQLLRFACLRDHDEACASLDARGLGRDDMKNAWAMLELGDLRTAQELFAARCTANIGTACNEAGRLLINLSGENGRAEAAKLYARACALGSAVGCYNSGDGLRKLGGQANLVAARTALTKACSLNDAPSCRLAGFMNGAGEGGPVDRVEANRLYEIACTGKDASACHNLGNSYVNGTGVAVDVVRARALHEQACELGSIPGCVSSGFAWGTGQGGPQDDVRAKALYARACEANNGQGCNNLAFYLREGRGGGADHVQSRALYEKGCNLRNADACIGSSDALLSSRGGPIDRTKAITMRRFACLVLNKAEACQWLSDGGHSDPLEEGAMLANTGKVQEGLPLLRQACDAGQADGCLGVWAFTPPGNAAVEAQRQTYLRRACTLGQKTACDQLN